ncbi:MAG: hypothetical protein HDKAJFGB_01744 [Anaerolineae bacterium]|nr:hypothetical protein [Anaerolineae bacterium]
MHAQRIGRKGFDNKIVHAQPQRLNRHLHIAITGHGDNHHFHIARAQPSRDLQTVQARQTNVGEQHIKRFGLEPQQRVLAARNRRHAIPLRFKNPQTQFQDGGVVVHNQYAFSWHRRALPAFDAAT